MYTETNRKRVHGDAEAMPCMGLWHGLGSAAPLLSPKQRTHRALSRLVIIMLFFCLVSVRAYALGEPRYVAATSSSGSFELAQTGSVAPLLVSAADWPGVMLAAADLRDDLRRVTGIAPPLLRDRVRHAADVVLIGTIGKSPLIDNLVRQGRLDVSGIAGKWEAEVTTVVNHPMPGVRRALVIAGADKRGTIFGIYDLSEQIGVSPWYWWADVCVPHRETLYVPPGRYVQATPAVKYRGIFLNDEAPALSGWTQEKFGGMNSQFYRHVFELLLRLKANYLWPAMWNNAFAEDDPKNSALADEYGIVMGTSHEEPMMRAEKEWTRGGHGPWDYNANSKEIDAYWRAGMERNKRYEQIVTLGMRGVNDTAMSASTNTAALERVVADQRQILKETVNADLTKTPQVWALYKEVQGYYEKGMRVPDDVTLLWSDDNWGNLRRLPTAEERQRPGGAGIYYHLDYVGGPRSYKWLNTTPIPKIQEQMNLAVRYGADRIWVVNVGDLKPMEFPIEFFLSMARTPARWDADHLHEFTVDWAAREFGAEHAEEIATSMEEYTRYNGRRKPELIDAATFSQTNYREADRVEAEWRALAHRVDKLAAKLSENQRASFFELIQYPVDACANLAKMYIAAGRNTLAARQGRADTAIFAQETRELFAKDAMLTEEYNHNLLHGRWDHMMDQTHIGYWSWHDPPVNVMPAVTEVQAADPALLGVVAEGGLGSRPSFGTVDSVAQQTRTLLVFNGGRAPTEFHITASDPWIVPSRDLGTVSTQETLQIKVDWATVPPGISRGVVTVSSKTGPPFRIPLEVNNLGSLTRTTAEGFVESDGYVAIEAADTAARHADGDVHWQELPGYGATRSAMTVFPVEAASDMSSTAALDYRVFLTEAGQMTMQATLAPTQQFVPGRGLRFSVSVDEGPRTLIDTLEHNTQSDWEQAVSDGVRRVSVGLPALTAGYHTLHLWAVDPAIVLERLVLYRGTLRPSYLGPPESFGPTRSMVN